MKISKSLLQAIAIAVAIGTVSACTKDKTTQPNDEGNQKSKVENHDNCPACGMG